MKFGDVMKKVELLAPAGNMHSLKAAVMAGCDAVYLGGKNFGARAFSLNFTNEEIVEAINYCHLYGVLVYVTVNTLVYENEVEDFITYIDFLHRNNVDAVIIQDLGMFDLVRKTFPNLELHASTQMHIHNLDGTKLMEKLGIERVVLARELNIDEIPKISEILNKQDRPIVFLLWGSPAQKKTVMLNNPNHLVLCAPHPSPLSAYRGFFGCKHFSQTNEFLVKHGYKPIDWQIENMNEGV